MLLAISVYACQAVLGEERSAYISTGDNQWVFILPMDSNAAVTTAIDTLAKDWAVTRLLWRGGQDEFWQNRFRYREQNRFYWEMSKWFGDLINGAGTNNAAIAAAHNNGMEIWMVYGLFEFRGPADTALAAYPCPNQAYCTIEHPEWMPVNKYGTRRQAGPVAFCYPEARAHVIKELTDFLVSRGYDGISFYTYAENYAYRYLDEFGYNQPIVDEFRNRYGVDIRTEEFDRNAWARLRGEYVTQFLAELKAALAPYGKKIDVWLNYEDANKPMYWASASPPVVTAGNIYMDWQSWVDQSIVDSLTVSWSWPPNNTLINQLSSYCQGSSTSVAAFLTYGTLPTGTIRVFIPGGSTETGYTYDNKVGYGGENTPAEPLSSLYGTDVYAKRRVLYLIQKGSLTATVADIIPVLNDNDIYVRRGALKALTALGDTAAVPYLEAALQDVQNSVRCQAALSLGDLRGVNSVQKLFDAVDLNGTFQFNFEAVKRSLSAMKAAGKITSDDVNVFIAALNSPNVDVRRAVLSALGQINSSNWPELVPNMIGILQSDSDPFARELAISALGQHSGDPIVKAALEQAFYDQDEVVQVRAAGYQSADNLISLFKRYGDLCTRSDADWGWRVIGNMISNETAFNELLYRKDDHRLAELTWQVLHIPQRGGTYTFATEQEDAQAHIYRPILKNRFQTTIFYDSFEDVNGVETYPDPNVDADPVAITGTWSQIREPNIYDVQVSRDHSPGAYERGKYLGLAQQGDTCVRGSFSPEAVNYSNYPLMLVSFDLYLKSGSGDVRFFVRNSTDTNWDQIVLNSLFGSDGTIKYQAGANWVDTGLTFNPDQWHRVIYVIHFDSNTYDMYIADHKVSSLPMYSSQSWAGQVVFTGSAGSSSTFYLDDIKIDVKPNCAGWPQADLNGDCRVDFIDFVLFSEKWLIGDIP